MRHSKTTVPTTIRPRAGALVLMFGVFISTGMFAYNHAEAFGRDADGSRMQARHVNLGAKARDTLMPPKDNVDWRAFKVTSVKSVAIDAQHKPVNASLTLSLVNSRGQQIASTSSRKGRASLSRMLKPGVYYLSASSTARMSYRLTIR